MLDGIAITDMNGVWVNRLYLRRPAFQLSLAAGLHCCRR
jgi:hypothetical protein